MNKEFHAGNRARLYDMRQPDSFLLLFSGKELRKSADANYLFFADRNFLYFTGIRQKESVLLAEKDREGNVTEALYLLPKDTMAERWTGRRLEDNCLVTETGCENLSAAIPRTVAEIEAAMAQK